MSDRHRDDDDRESSATTNVRPGDAERLDAIVRAAAQARGEPAPPPRQSSPGWRPPPVTQAKIDETAVITGRTPSQDFSLPAWLQQQAPASPHAYAPPAPQQPAHQSPQQPSSFTPASPSYPVQAPPAHPVQPSPAYPVQPSPSYQAQPSPSYQAQPSPAQPASPWPSHPAPASPSFSPAAPLAYAPPQRVAAPAASPSHDASAALHGVGAASDAATASNAARVEPPRAEPIAVPAPKPKRAGGTWQLVWIDPAIAPRVRAQKAWSSILTALEERPLDRELEDYDQRFSTSHVEDRRAVFEVLARGEPSDASLEELLRRGMREDGRFLPALALLGGELEPTFDERSTLAVSLSLAAPLTLDDDTRAAIAEGKALLELPAASVPGSLFAAATDRLRRAFSAQRRGNVPPRYLEEQADRALLRQRAYQRRLVLDGEQLRHLFWTPGVTRPAVAYLPAKLERVLPLVQRLPVRLLAEVEARLDDLEDAPAALRVTAIARAVG